MKKRLFAALLAVLLLAASCADGKTENGDPAEGKTSDVSGGTPEAEVPAEETEPHASLPVLTYDGAQVTVWGDIAGFERFYDAEMNGDVVCDAVSERNAAVSDRFDIKLVYDLKPGNWRPQEELFESVLAGAGAFDIATGVSCYLSASGIKGCFCNLYRMDLIDLNEPWYMRFVNDNILIGDKLIFAAGFFDMPSLARATVTYFSTDLAEQYDVGDLYGLVREGGWTYDYMMRIGEGVLTDLDGNGAYTKKDRYGITSQWDCIGFQYVSTGHSFVTRDEEGGYSMTLPDDALFEANELLHKLLYECDYYYSGYDMGKEHNDLNMEKVFTENRALFFINSAEYAEKESMREMGNYGIIPPPKFTEEQARYGSTSSVHLAAIPIDTPDRDRSAAVYEALQYESWERVRPAYYDIALSQKYVHDPESAEMLDITFDNIHCDFLYIYAPGVGNAASSYWLGVIDNYASWFQSNLKANNTLVQNFVELIESFED